MKMLVDGEYPSPFSAKVPYDPEKFPKYDKVGEMVRELSRLRYGRDRGMVEAEITRRSEMNMGGEDDAKPAGGMGGFQTPLKAAEDKPAGAAGDGGAGASVSGSSGSPAPGGMPDFSSPSAFPGMSPAGGTI
jgi:hypothetical protein